MWPYAIDSLNRVTAVSDYHGLSKQMLNAALGYALFMEGRFTEAVAADRKALTYGGSQAASYNLVLADIKVAALEDARKDLQQGIQLGGKPNVDLTPLSGLINSAAAAAKLSAHAAELHSQADYGGSATEYVAAAKLQPDNGRLFANAGLCMLERNDYDLAVKYLNLAAQRSSPLDPLPHIGLGDTECRRKRWDNADGEYALAIDTDPTSLQARISHEECLKRKGDWTEQEAVLKDMLRIAPDNPEVLNGYGYELALHGERLPEALSMIQRAVTASPTNGSYLDSLAWAQFKLGQLEQAMQTIQAASHSTPKDPTLLEHYGDIALANHDPTSAGAAWSALLKTSTDPEQKTRVQKKLGALGSARPAR
jgi:tetratricopeptide (TPR) repeat protein